MVIPREPYIELRKVLQGRRRDYTRTPRISKAYLLGVLHDATVRKLTYRIATKNKDFAEIIKSGILNLGKKAWIYKEGKMRNLWIVEFSKSLINTVRVRSKQGKIDYIRGFSTQKAVGQKVLRSDFIYTFAKRVRAHW